MFAPIYYYFALFLFVNSVDVCTSHEFSGVVYFQEIWEKKIDLPPPLERRVTAINDRYESVILLVELQPKNETIDDVDLIVSDCEQQNIFGDNIGYSYTYGKEVLIVNIDTLSGVCIHVFGNKRKHFSAFDLSLQLKTEEEAFAYTLGGKKMEYSNKINGKLKPSSSSYNYDDHTTTSSYTNEESTGVENIFSIIIEIIKLIFKTLA